MCLGNGFREIGTEFLQKCGHELPFLKLKWPLKFNGWKKTCVFFAGRSFWFQGVYHVTGLNKATYTGYPKTLWDRPQESCHQVPFCTSSKVGHISIPNSADIFLDERKLSHFLWMQSRNVSDYLVVAVSNMFFCQCSTPPGIWEQDFHPDWCYSSSLVFTTEFDGVHHYHHHQI